MHIHLHKDVCALRVSVFICVYTCEYACSHVPMRMCPSLYPSVMNSQLMKEPLLLPFHQPGNNYLVSEAILHLYHTLQLHLAAISLKIQFFLFLPFFPSPIPSLPILLHLHTPSYLRTDRTTWPHTSLSGFKYDELIYSIKWQMIVRGIWLLKV